MNSSKKRQKSLNPKNYRYLKERLIFNLILILSVLFIFSCSEDEEPIIPEASDINISLDENPTEQRVVGGVTTNLTGELMYSISTQSVNGALSINSETGEVSIENINVFDYEVNPIIEADISVTNTTYTANASVTITLNNLDDIQFFLTSSRQAYIDAQNGDWILITEEEYNLLATKLYNVNTTSTSNEHYNTEEPISYDSINYTYCNNNSVDIAPSHFVFAIKYKGNEDNVTEAKVKASNTSVSEGFIDLGSILPEHNAGDNYFVMKGNSMNSENNSYLGIYAELAYINIDNHNFKYKSGDSQELTFDWTGIALYQGLTTDTKQWD